MIERHVTFNVIPGKEKDFETLFKEEYSLAMSKQPGFVSVVLLKEHEKEAIYQMVIRFQSLETAATWRDSARFSTGTRFPPRLMLPRTTIWGWIGLLSAPEQRATKLASVIACVGPVLCSSTMWRW
jgi:heme-degrading monooxygenase HmoA